MHGAASIVISVLTDVASHYICMWLDRKLNHFSKNCKH